MIHGNTGSRTEASPLLYPHNHDFSHIHILQGESESVPCQCNNISCKAELRQTRLTPRIGSVDLSQAYSCAVITVPYFY
jgi:hypothetical protein